MAASRSTKAARIVVYVPAWAQNAVHGIDHGLSHLDRIALDDERTGLEGTTHFAGRRIFVDIHAHKKRDC